MTSRNSDSEPSRRHLSPRDRHWIASLVFAVLFVLAGAVVVGWTIPRALGKDHDLRAALIFVAWIGIAGIAVLLIGRGAGRGDEIADRALDRRRDGQDWHWPERPR